MRKAKEVKRSVHQRVMREELILNGKVRLFPACGHVVVRTKKHGETARCSECAKHKNLEYVDKF